MEVKRELRSAMRDIRRAIAADPVDRLARSARIWERIVDVAALDRGRRVMLFESLPTEPATESWFEWCRDHDVDVFIPAVDGPALRVEPGDVDPGTLDVVVVPGLAFTADGRRLGQGGGHYDRFLTRVRPSCVTIGAAFHEQVLDDVPTEPHDVRLDVVVTDLDGAGDGAGAPAVADPVLDTGRLIANRQRPADACDGRHA